MVLSLVRRGGDSIFAYDSNLATAEIEIFAFLSEVMNTRKRPDSRDFAAILTDHPDPNYGLLFESHTKAQSVQKVEKGTELNHVKAA